MVSARSCVRTNAEMEFSYIYLTKDSSILLHAIHSPFYWRIKKKNNALLWFFNSNPGGYFKLHWVVAISWNCLLLGSWSCPQPPRMPWERNTPQGRAIVPASRFFGCLNKKVLYKIIVTFYQNVKNIEISHQNYITNEKMWKCIIFFNVLNIFYQKNVRKYYIH